MASSKKSYVTKKQYPIYALQGRYERNRTRTIKRHLKKHPRDSVALRALERTI